METYGKRKGEVERRSAPRREDTARFLEDAAQALSRAAATIRNVETITRLNAKHLVVVHNKLLKGFGRAALKVGEIVPPGWYTEDPPAVTEKDLEEPTS
jgi:hypothetical protein